MDLNSRGSNWQSRWSSFYVDECLSCPEYFYLLATYQDCITLQEMLSHLVRLFLTFRKSRAATQRGNQRGTGWARRWTDSRARMQLHLWHAARLVSCVHSPKIDTFPFRPSWLTWNIMTLPLTEKYSFIFTATKPPGDSCVPRTEQRFLLLGPSRQSVLCLASKSFFSL